MVLKKENIKHFCNLQYTVWYEMSLVLLIFWIKQNYNVKTTIWPTTQFV